MSLLDGFAIVPLKQEDAAVQTRADAFFKSVGVDKPWRPPIVKWLGFVKDGTISLVVSVFLRPDDKIEVLDFYPAPTRDGVKAGYVGLRMLKALVDEGIVISWIGGVVARNKKGQRRAERYFGISPLAVVYEYGGNV